MSITFVQPTGEALRAQHDHYWSGALAALSTPQADSTEIASVMPYFAAQRAAEKHVEHCEPCNEGSWLDLCPEGDRLFSIAADACAAQSDLAGQN